MFVNHEPRNNEKYYWTEHAKGKLKQYGLSPQRVIRIINYPLRREAAVAPGCLACLQRVGNKKKTEIWVMYQEKIKNKKLKIKDNEEKIDKDVFLGSPVQKIMISAWRYPGLTKPGKPVPVPEDTLAELDNLTNKFF